MAYRRPTSSICLLKGVPCDHEYHHSVWYTSRQAQFDDMMTFPHEWFNHLSYQRKGRNSFKIEVPVNSFYSYLDYNYVIFSNASVDIDDYSTITKQMNLFYCFLDTIEYVNDNAIEVFYNIDYIQTYMFDYRLGQCFVEREHSYSDNLYEHLESEPFSPQDYYYSLGSSNDFSDNLAILIKYVPNQHIITRWYFDIPDQRKFITFERTTAAADTPKGRIINRTYTGTYCVSFPLFFDTADPTQEIDTLSNIRSALNNIGATTDIVEISILPSVLCPHKTIIENNRTYYLESEYPDSIRFSYSNTRTVNQLSAFSDAKGNFYQPKNKKLFSYPYNSLYLTNEQGDSKEVLWENFQTLSAEFGELGVRYGCPELILYPKYYNGRRESIENSVLFQNFPTCTWNFDSAAIYWQENKAQITSNIIRGAILTAMGITLPNVGISSALSDSMAITASQTSPFVANVLSGVPYSPANPLPQMPNVNVSGGGIDYRGLYGGSILANTLAKIIDSKAIPDKLQGTQTYSQMPVLTSSFGIKIFHKSIKPYEAKQIDDYFSMFGYAVKSVKTPNLFTANGTNRPEWYYIKNAYTKIDNHFALSPQPIIDGYVNEETESKLKEIYSNGITFWFNSSHVGNYSLDNSPTT